MGLPTGLPSWQGARNDPLPKPRAGVAPAGFVDAPPEADRHVKALQKAMREGLTLSLSGLASGDAYSEILLRARASLSCLSHISPDLALQVLIASGGSRGALPHASEAAQADFARRLASSDTALSRDVMEGFCPDLIGRDPVDEFVESMARYVAGQVSLYGNGSDGLGCSVLNPASIPAASNYSFFTEVHGSSNLDRRADVWYHAAE